MKKLTYLALAITILVTSTTGCHRNRKVNYARVPLDTAAHNDLPTAQDTWDQDEAVIDIPDIPQESDYKDADRNSVEKMMRGEY